MDSMVPIKCLFINVYADLNLCMIMDAMWIGTLLSRDNMTMADIFRFYCRNAFVMCNLTCPDFFF